MPRGRKAKATEEKKAEVIVTEEAVEGAVENTETAEDTEVVETAETVEAAEEVKEEAVETSTQEEAEEKPAPKKRGRKPGATKAKEEAEEKSAPKKRGRKPGAPKVKETPAKEAAPKEAEANIVLQFDFGEFISKDLVEKCKQAYQAENKTKIKSIDIYVKPSDKKAYYVVNDKSAGYVDLEN